MKRRFGKKPYGWLLHVYHLVLDTNVCSGYLVMTLRQDAVQTSNLPLNKVTQIRSRQWLKTLWMKNNNNKVPLVSVSNEKMAKKMH